MGLAGAVSKVNKTNGTFSTVGFHEADHGDLASDKVAAVCLQFAEGVCAVSGWYPRGHAAGVEAHNMNHSLRSADISFTDFETNQSVMHEVLTCPKSLEQRRFGWVMSSRAGRAVFCVLALMAMSLTPLVMPVSADDSILLSVDVQHAVLEPGQSTNITLNIENNGSSIESYNITIDESSLAAPWTVLPVDSTISNVFPTWSKNTTLVVRLAEGATVADSSSFIVNVTEPDAGVSSHLTVLVSVAPAYHPSLSVGGSPLVPLAAGESTNVSFTAHNLGTVTDTFLLDVEVQPDLAAWWANHSNGTSGNSSDNGTGNGTGNTTSTSMSVMMMGNSYTNANNLAAVVEGVMDADGYNATVQSVTSGGMKLPQHWQNVNTSGNQWNTTLRGAAWDYVILQDQSQVPSFPTTELMWQQSKDAAVNLSNAIEDEGAETMLFMTWGYRDGDSLNSFNNNFTNMQSRLTEGYTRYAENISNAGNSVWIAPVGLAYKTVHDAVVADGDDPTASGNLFYDLYTSDGSHPSLSGSYLAACVFHSSTTGETCVGSNDTVNLNASVKLTLQQAADDTVFNQTSGMSYYPWEISGTAAFGLGSSIPQGWYIQWQEDELANIAAGGSESATLSITVPSDAAPDFYGFRLTIGSTNGNITSSTIIVVEVETEPAASLAFLRQSDVFLPGSSTTTGVQVSNTGNAPLSIDWTLSVPPAAGAIPCTVSLVTPQTLDLQPDDVGEVELMVDVDENADSSAQCPLRLTASHAVDDTTSVLEELDFTVEIDEYVNFTLSGPMTIVDIVPDVGTNYELRLTNHGSDAAVFFLDITESSGLDTVLVTASGVSIAAGETGTWTVNTKGDPLQSGILEQAFSATYNGLTSTLQVPINLLEVDGFDILPPSEDRVLIAPGASSNFTITLRNSGTSNYTASPSLSGLPADIDVSFDVEDAELDRGSEQTVNLVFSADTGATPSSSTVTLTYLAASLSVSYSFDVVIVDREDVAVTAVQTRLLASPSSPTSTTVDVTNLGTASDVYLVEWNTGSQGNWFDVAITPTTFQLSSGSSQQVSITVQEIASGAPEAGVIYTLRVASSTNPNVVDEVFITVQPVAAGANMTVLTDVGSAKPGGSVYGSILLSNTGNTEDTFAITTVGIDCGLDVSVTVAPGLASDAFGWSCVVPNDAAAGQRAITFRAVSTVRSNVVVEQSTLYEVEASWPGDSLVALSFSDGRLTLGADSSTTTLLTVQNLANAEVSGTLNAYGQDTGLVVLEWIRMSDDASTTDYTLSPGSSVDFQLTITSNTARAAVSEVSVRATSTGGGVLTTDEAVPLPITIEGPALPPNGLSLPLGVQVSQNAALGVMGAGWLLAVVAVQLLRRTPRSESDEVVEEEDEIEEEEKEVPDLGYNECRMDGESKVNCPSCDARLGVPRGSAPPFRFTCPQCDNKIRVVE